MNDELLTQSNNSTNLKSAHDWEQEAHQLALEQEWTQAARTLQHAADIDPGEAHRWLKIATWFQYGGEVGDAIQALLRALNIPKNINPNLHKSTFTDMFTWSTEEEWAIWSALAHLYAQASRWPECETACLKVLERQSDDLEITELMATACLQTDHLDAAEHLLQTLLRRVPLDPWYRMRYATLLQMQGRLGAAQEELLRLQSMSLPDILAPEVESSINYLNQLQFQQVMMLLEHNMELQNTLARDPRAELRNLGFVVTDSVIDMLQNVLWEHFDQAPFNTPEVSEHVPRIH